MRVTMRLGLRRMYMISRYLSLPLTIDQERPAFVYNTFIMILAQKIAASYRHD